jgi:anti-sigma regulatory factor (Ser/Thr protein kinase)
MQALASLSLVPGSDTVAKALAWLEVIAEQERWPDRTAFRLSLCLDEALANIVMHGFKGRSGDASAARIALQIQAGEQQIVLEITDNGMPFDPTQVVPPDLAVSVEDASLGGHGLRLMQHYLQDIQYRRIQGQNHLRLTCASSPVA